MKALVINCSPVRNGATAEITGIIAEELSGSFDVKTYASTITASASAKAAEAAIRPRYAFRRTTLTL